MTVHSAMYVKSHFMYKYVIKVKKKICMWCLAAVNFYKSGTSIQCMTIQDRLEAL